MRVFTLITSAVFVAIGILSIASGDSVGYWITGFFAACALVAMFEPNLPKPWLESEFQILITDDDVTCLFRRKPRESIRWEDVERVWYVTTSHGPYSPDQWFVLEGASSGCAFPTEAKGIEAIWDQLEQRFPGFDFSPVIRGGTTDARHLCWERQGRIVSEG